jgi:hypothetical protein
MLLNYQTISASKIYHWNKKQFPEAAASCPWKRGQVI